MYVWVCVKKGLKPDPCESPGIFHMRVCEALKPDPCESRAPVCAINRMPASPRLLFRGAVLAFQ